MRESNGNRTLTRERFGMVLCILAVASLSSVIVQWSKHFPEQETALETSLFGDLVEETSDQTGDRRPIPPLDVSRERQSGRASVDRVIPSTTVLEVDAAERAQVTPTLLVPHVRFTAPVDAEPASVQTVSYSEEASPLSLSGRIEEVDPPSASRTKSSSDNVVRLGTIIPEER